MYKLNLREDLEPRASLIAPTNIKATANKSQHDSTRFDDYGLSEFAILYRVNGAENQQRISLGVPPLNDSQRDLGAPRSGTWPLQWNIPDDIPNLVEVILSRSPSKSLKSLQIKKKLVRL